MKRSYNIPPLRWMLVNFLLTFTAMFLKSNPINIYILKSCLIILSLALSTQLIANHRLEDYNIQLTNSSAISDIVSKKKPQIARVMVQLLIAFLAGINLYKYDMWFFDKAAIYILVLILVVVSIKDLYTILCLKNEDVVVETIIKVTNKDTDQN